MINLPAAFCNLFRAIEIAKTGGFSVRVIFNTDYKTGLEDYQKVKEYCKGWFENFKGGDKALTVEMCKPELGEYKYGETLQDIENRIDKSLLFPLPEPEFNTASESLLKVACTRLDISLKGVDLIREVARIIARMSFSKEIKIEHVAEAIQLSKEANYGDSYVLAETPQTIFDNKIFIVNTDIDSDVIKKAIEHLQSRLVA